MTRRRLLQSAAGALALGLPGIAAAQAPLPRVVQLLDMSPQQQDVSRDYATGLRTAWAESGASLATLVTVNVHGDADPQTLDGAMRQLAQDRSVVAIVGTAGESLALECADWCGRQRLEIAHIAPWLADSRHDEMAGLLPLFASRGAQVQRAIEALGQSGHQSLQVVYPSSVEETRQDAAIRELAEPMKLRLAVLTGRPGEDAAALAARVPADGPAMVLFLGGTLELAGFAQRLAARRLSRYLICLADVDLTVLRQLGVGTRSKVPLILTQVVPDPGSALPVVQRYRQGLQRLFEEAPTPLSLAGYLAGRYTAALLQRTRTPGRAALLAAARERPGLELDGFELSFRNRARGSTQVSHAMLTADGRLLR